MAEAKQEVRTETRDLFNAQEGLIPRDGGPYLDREEREKAEIRRAKKEGRKPDLENPPPVAGTQLVTYDLLSDGHQSNPSHREFLDSPQLRKDFKPDVVQTVEVDRVPQEGDPEFQRTVPSAPESSAKK